VRLVCDNGKCFALLSERPDRLYGPLMTRIQSEPEAVLWEKMRLKLHTSNTHTAPLTQKLRPGMSSESWNWVYRWLTVYVNRKMYSLNPNSNTLEPDRTQRGRPAVSVIAQQYSSAAYISLRFHSR